jgi:hypothetical protein
VECGGYQRADGWTAIGSTVWQVNGLEEGTKNFTWAIRRPGVQVTDEHLVEASGDGSWVTLTIELSRPLGPLIASLNRKSTERYLALAANGLKDRSEEPVR